jgi:hypothetical protein
VIQLIKRYHSKYIHANFGVFCVPADGTTDPPARKVTLTQGENPLYHKLIIGPSIIDYRTEGTMLLR